MTYYDISNEPLTRSSKHFAWTYYDDVFTNDELNSIIEISSKKELNFGQTINTSPDEDIRKSRINFHEPNNENFWIFQRLNSVIASLNNRFYNYDLNGYDSYQYSEYNATEDGKYDFHMDYIMTGDKIISPFIEPRKLSLVLLLSEPNVDFEGGEFEMNLGRIDVVPMKRGRIIVFPSFLIHRVAEVTKGIRKSLVVWVTGPKFK